DGLGSAALGKNARELFERGRLPHAGRRQFAKRRRRERTDVELIVRGRHPVRLSADVPGVPLLEERDEGKLPGVFFSMKREADARRAGRIRGKEHELDRVSLVLTIDASELG